MDGETSSSATVVAVILILLVLFVVILGGGAAYMFLARQQAVAVAQMEMARAAEAQARLQAEQARDQLETAQAAGAGEPAADSDNITGLLQHQQQAWNDGDLDRFMETYWNSDELTFSSGGETTRGWAATLQRYRDKYPDSQTMGKLTLDNLEVSTLGDSAAFVLGKWKIDRESESLTGNFSLVVRKFEDGWKIVHDHTSRVTE